MRPIIYRIPPPPIGALLSKGLICMPSYKKDLMLKKTSETFYLQNTAKVFTMNRRPSPSPLSQKYHQKTLKMSSV